MYRARARREHSCAAADMAAMAAGGESVPRNAVYLETGELVLLDPWQRSASRSRSCGEY